MLSIAPANYTTITISADNLISCLLVKYYPITANQSINILHKGFQYHA